MKRLILISILALFLLTSVSALTWTSHSQNFNGNVSFGENFKIKDYGTGDILDKEYDLEIGGEYGAVEIGDIEIFMPSFSVGGMDLDGSALFRNEKSSISSMLEFGFVTTDNKIRFAIPKAGGSLATYNPRSFMIGGDLGQEFDDDIINCVTQGYKYIDCNTSTTGADLGVQDDLEVRGDIYLNSTLKIHSPNGSLWDCGVDNGGVWSCS